MQTFLSEDTFESSARALDSKRLNKQSLEGRQMLNALAGNQKGFVNHPATKMWKGYEGSLVTYLYEVGKEAVNRGIKTEANWQAICDIASDNDWSMNKVVPPWWSDHWASNRIITTHRASLYAKDPEHYVGYELEYYLVDSNPLDWVCCPTRRQGQPCGYYWPTHQED